MLWETVKFVNIIKLLVVIIIEIFFLMKCNCVYISSLVYDLTPRNQSSSLSLFPVCLPIFCLSRQNVITVCENNSVLRESLELEFLAELWTAIVALGYELSLHLITGQWCPVFHCHYWSTCSFNLPANTEVETWELLKKTWQCSSKHLGKCADSLFSMTAQDFMS